MLDTWRKHVEDARANRNVFSAEAKYAAWNSRMCLRGSAGNTLEELGIRLELEGRANRYHLALLALKPYIDLRQLEWQFMLGVRDGDPRKVEDAIEAVEEAIMQAKRRVGQFGSGPENDGQGGEGKKC